MESANLSKTTIDQNKILRDTLSIAHKAGLPLDIIDSHIMNEIRRKIYEMIRTNRKPEYISIELAMKLIKKLKQSQEKQTDFAKQTDFDMHEFQKRELGSERELAIEERHPSLSTGFQGTDTSQVRIMGDFVVQDDKADIQEEIQAANVHLMKLFGVSNPYHAVAIFNPENLKRREYLLLDSRYAAEEGFNLTSFTWYYQSTALVQTGSTNSTDKIKNITAIKLLGFSLNRRYETQLNRYTILIRELAAQSFIGPTGRRFHFWGRSIRDPTVASADTFVFLDFNESENMGVFRFRQPIVSLDKLTISVGSPYDLISFIPARIRGCTLDLTGYPNTWVIITPEDHPWMLFSTIEVLYVEYFTTTNPAADDFNIKYITKATGHRAVATSIPDPDELTVTNDFSFAPASAFPAFVGTPSTLVIYASNPRLFIHLEIEYIDPASNVSLVELERINDE